MEQCAEHVNLTQPPLKVVVDELKYIILTSNKLCFVFKYGLYIIRR